MQLLEHLDRDHAWKLVETGSAIAAAAAIRQGMRFGWRRATGEEPPLNPASPETPWRQAIAWTTVSVLAVGTARLLARRGAASGWKKVTGRWPPLA